MHPPVKNSFRGLFCAAIALALCSQLTASAKDIVYLTPGLDLPFWRYLSEGVESVAKKEGYGFQAFDSHNDAQTQLKNAQDAIARGVAGIVISPTDSSTCPSVLGARPESKYPGRDRRHWDERGRVCLFHHLRQSRRRLWDRQSARCGDEGKRNVGRDGRTGDDLAHQEQREAANRGFPRRIARGRNQGVCTRADAELYGKRNVQVHSGHAYCEPKHEGNVHRDRSANHGCLTCDKGGSQRRIRSGRWASTEFRSLSTF